MKWIFWLLAFDDDDDQKIQVKKIEMFLRGFFSLIRLRYVRAFGSREAAELSFFGALFIKGMRKPSSFETKNSPNKASTNFGR